MRKHTKKEESSSFFAYRQDRIEAFYKTLNRFNTTQPRFII